MAQQLWRKHTMQWRTLLVKWNNMSRLESSSKPLLPFALQLKGAEVTKFNIFSFAVSFQVWLQYQCLWDMQAENIYNRLGEDLTKWQALLVQIRKARGTFDNAETRKEFGPVVIDYGKVKILMSFCIMKNH